MSQNRINHDINRSNKPQQCFSSVRTYQNPLLAVNFLGGDALQQGAASMSWHVYHRTGTRQRSEVISRMASAGHTAKRSLLSGTNTAETDGATSSSLHAEYSITVPRDVQSGFQSNDLDSVHNPELQRVCDTDTSHHSRRLTGHIRPTGGQADSPPDSVVFNGPGEGPHHPRPEPPMA